jgi:hypothetical protein
LLQTCDIYLMRADKVEVSWDQDKRKWLVRIEAGSEVIRRHCDDPRDADDNKLHALAEQTVIDEGYVIDKARISVVR